MRAWDEDTRVFFSSLAPLGPTALFLEILPFISDPGNLCFFLIFCEPCIYYFFYTGTYDVKFKDGFKLEVDYEDLRPVKVCLLKPALCTCTCFNISLFTDIPFTYPANSEGFYKIQGTTQT